MLRFSRLTFSAVALLCAACNSHRGLSDAGATEGAPATDDAGAGGRGGTRSDPGGSASAGHAGSDANAGGRAAGGRGGSLEPGNSAADGGEGGARSDAVSGDEDAGTTAAGHSADAGHGGSSGSSAGRGDSEAAGESGAAGMPAAHGGGSASSGNGGASGELAAGSGALCASCGGCEEVQPIATNIFHTDDPIDYPDPPPTSGPHNMCWTTWGVHDTPVRAERWVHNLEHGGVVYLYNCPDGCAADVAALSQIVGTHGRTVLTAYAALPTRFGVVSWGHRLLASCVDVDAFTKFYLENFDHGSESLDTNPDPSCPP